jgi:hypothetical protein
VTDRIVFGGRVLLDASFRAARARLGILARDGMLAWASEVAYGEAITGLVKAAGPAAGLTRLAGVCLGDLAGTDDCAHIRLQWKAIAADGKLFTALDADLMLAPAGDTGPNASLDYYDSLDADLMLVPVADQITALALAGAYWPQPGRGGAGLDQTMVRECATAAIRSFLDRVAYALIHPAGTAGSRRGPAEGYGTAGRQGQAAICGVNCGILGALMLIIAGSFALLAELLTWAVTTFRRRRARCAMPVAPVVSPVDDGGPAIKSACGWFTLFVVIAAISAICFL